MTYDEYMLTKRNIFIYNGQSEEELKKDLFNSYKYDCLNIDEQYKYLSIKPPAGTIIVGSDMMDKWISSKQAFYGWNIQIVKDYATKEIKIK